MNGSLFEILVLKTLGMTFLLLLIVSLRPWILKWSNARVAYGLWLMLPIYLIVPINFVEATSSAGVMTFILGDNSVNLLPPRNDWLSTEIADFLLDIWIVGILMVLSVFTFRYQKLKNSLTPLSKNQISSENQQAFLAQLKSTTLVNSDLIDVPAVFGFFKAHLVLPYDFSELSEKKQYMILNHEFYHLHRHDHRMNFVRVVIKSLFWFNPLFYWADKYCEADQELSCDLGVLQHSEVESRISYAKVLMESVTGKEENRLLSQWKYQSLIKERIKMLKNIESKKWHSWVAVIFASCAIWFTSGMVMAGKGEDITVEAVPTKVIPPRYPIEAVKAGIEGWVKFSFNVDTNGHPYEVKLLDAKSANLFENGARQAFYQWQFDTNKGQNQLIYTMEFTLAPQINEAVNESR